MELKFCFTDRAARAGDTAAQALLMPRRASEMAAGIDLVAANEEPLLLTPGQRVLVPTGIAIALPEGFEGQVRPRSGLALKHGVTCLNAPGTIDADYRGEVGVLLVHHGQEPLEIRRGMRIAQLVIAPVTSPTMVAVGALDETPRGTGGFGSTGGVGAP
ncbi:MAG: dUTP diphosphatase [Myxococcota bacterium]